MFYLKNGACVFFDSTQLVMPNYNQRGNENNINKKQLLICWTLFKNNNSIKSVFLALHLY